MKILKKQICGNEKGKEIQIRQTEAFYRRKEPKTNLVFIEVRNCVDSKLQGFATFIIL